MTTPTKEMAEAALRNYSQLYNSRGTQTDCNNYPYILRSRLAALEAENEKLKAAQRWQPIASAPKDGIFFLSTDHKQVWITRVAFTNSGKAKNRFTSAPYGLLGGRPNKATHWMPLPEPPKEGV